jgi:hypothetical protein
MRRLSALPARPERAAILREIDLLEKLGPELAPEELVGALGRGHELVRRRIPDAGLELLIVHDMARAELHIVDLAAAGRVSPLALAALARRYLGLPGAVFEPYGDVS